MITTHVLDTALGRPAAGVPITLERLERLEQQDGADWRPVASGVTDADGRLRTLDPPRLAGTYRLRFDTAAYFRAAGQSGFYPFVEVVFLVADPAAHHHVPLLLSPFGYATYRGS